MLGAVTGRRPSDAGAVTPTSVQLRDSLGFALRVFVVVEVGWLLLGVLGVLLIRSGTPVSVAGWPAHALTSGWHNAVTSGERQDALWYLRIATGGYRAGDAGAAFFPLYPLAIRVLALLPGLGPLGAATLVADGAFFGSLVVLHALTRREYDGEVARLAVVVTAVFPTAFFFVVPYSESLFLLLALLSFWWARSDRWLLAALAGAAAAATRSVGVVLFPALLVEAALQWRQDRRRLLPRAAASLGPLLGLGLYFAYWALRDGNASAPIDAQKNWQRQLAFPLTTLWRAIHAAAQNRSYWLLDVLVVGIVLVAVLAGVRQLRPSYLTYSLASLLLPLCEPFPDRPLLSMPRFVVLVWPAFWVIALAIRRRQLAESAVVGMFAAGWAVCGLLFINWLPLF